ncbi:MAG TPA: cytochrome ubiquinol oxidase subunit I [Candidatus Dormibacteraeota bacterium]
MPIVISGIGGTFSVVAANAWMNTPAGFTLDNAGKVVDVDPWGVIFNRATSGVWVTFVAIVGVYAAVITATVLVLRAMARRWRDEEIDESDVPYGPREPLRGPAAVTNAGS